MYKKGDLADEIYIIYEGQVIFLNDEQKPFLKFGAGTYFGEIEMLSNSTWTYSAYTDEEVHLGIVTKEDFWAAIKDYKKVLDQFIDIALKRKNHMLKHQNVEDDVKPIINKRANQMIQALIEEWKQEDIKKWIWKIIKDTWSKLE